MTTLSWEQAWHTKLRNAPQDAALWAAYGEALKAQGDPRSALITLEQQLQATTTQEARRALLERRSQIRRELRQAHGLDSEGLLGDWRWGLFWLSHVKGTHLDSLQRAVASPFVVCESLEMEAADAAALTGCLRQLERLAPTTLKLKLPREQEEILRVLQDFPYLARLEGFALYLEEDQPRLGDPTDLERILTGFDGDRLRHLKLWGCGLGPTGYQRLLALPRLRSLTSLSLGYEETNAAIAPVLAKADARPLRALSLCGCDVDTAGASLLANSPIARGLHTLSLWMSDVDDDCWPALCRGSELHALRTLDMGYNPCSPQSARLLARTDTLQGLEILDLAPGTLPHDALLTLLQSPCLPKLRHLHAGLDDWSEETLARLRPFRKRLFIARAEDCGTMGWEEHLRWHHPL